MLLLRTYPQPRWALISRRVPFTVVFGQCTYIIEIVLINLFSWPVKNLCSLSLAFNEDWRVMCCLLNYFKYFFSGYFEIDPTCYYQSDLPPMYFHQFSSEARWSHCGRIRWSPQLELRPLSQPTHRYEIQINFT